jgi:hypothetical protein
VDTGSGAPIVGGAFKFPNLPVGSYAVHVGNFPPKQVSIVAGQTTTVQFP